MSTITLTTTAVILWGFVLLLTAIILKKTLSQKKINWSKFDGIAVYAVFSIITILMIIYATSPSVDVFTRGGPAEFGQFGDMIGGILNPIFGFITVVLLLRSLKVQNYDLENARIMRDLETLTRTLNDGKERFRHLMDLERLKDEAGHFSYYSMFVDIQSGHSIERYKIFTAHADAIVEDIKNTGNTQRPYFPIIDLVSVSNMIIATYAEIIHVEDYKFMRSIQASELLRFVYEARNYHLISAQNFSELNDFYSKYLPKHADPIAPPN